MSFYDDPEREREFRRGLLDFGLSMLAQGGLPTSRAVGNAGLMALQQGQQREGLAQRAALTKAQLAEIQAHADQSKQQAETQRLAAEREAAFSRDLASMRQPQAQSAPQQVAPAGLTDWGVFGQQAAAPRSTGRVDWVALMAAHPQKADLIAKIAEAGNLGRPEVARTIEEAAAGGGRQTVQFDKYGQRVGAPVLGYIAPQLVDTGMQKFFATPTAGASFPVSMSPSERAANARGWANIDIDRRKAAAAEDANTVQREAQQSQIINDPVRGPIIVNKGTKTAVQATMDGKPVQGEDTAKALKRADQLVAGIAEARKLIPKATGSGAGAAYDYAGSVIGASPKGAVEAAQLKTLSGWMTANVPRMEGPQSNFDVKLYQDMAAAIGDSTVPRDRRMAALDTLETLQRKYAHLNGGAQPQEDPLGIRGQGAPTDDPLGIRKR